MSEYKYIWLQPECCASEYEGRLWCEVPDPEKCEDGNPWTKYVLASECETLQASLAAAQRERDEAVGMLSKLVKEADEGNPFCAVGHFVEHVIPDARRLTGQPEKPPEDTATMKDQMLYVGGSDRAFRCECGCNVFKEYKPNRYRCNSCKETYTGEAPVKEPPHDPL